jgi:Vitamin K-dependent gamma-carboxylase
VANRVEALVTGFVADVGSPRPLAVLRIGIATALIGEAAMVAPHLHDYYGPVGLVQLPLSEAFAHWSLPSLALLTRLCSSAGVADSTTVQVAFAVYVVALHLLLLGCWTRIAAVASWLLFLAFKKAGSVSAYGGFEFAQIALFYCALFPVGGALSIDAIRHPAPPSLAASIGVRLLQLHLCIVYGASGIEKSLGEQWWSGEAIWRALMRPGLVGFDFSWLADHPLLAKAACWGTMLCEAGYPLFIWIRRTRRIWLLAIIGLHVGIAITLGLVFFSAVMIVLNVAAFLVPGDVRTGTERPAQASSLQVRAAQQIPETRI